MISLPNGASSVEKTFSQNFEFLQQFKEIYISFDNDKAGEEAAKKAMSLLPPEKYRRLRFPQKDANDWLLENINAEFEDLQLLMQNAEKIEMPFITNILDLPEEYYNEVDLGVSSGFQKLDVILGGMRSGEVTVITADTGAGKSTFCLNLIKNIAELGNPVWINSYEMNPVMVNRKFASIILQKQMKYENFSKDDISEYQNWLKKHKVFLNATNGKADIETLSKQFELASLVHGVKFIILDHLDYIYSCGTKKTVLENIDEAMREIHVLAMKYKVGVILVVHPTKVDPKKELTMNDLKGSSAIKQYADNIIILTKMSRMQSSVSDNRIKVTIDKNRLCGNEGHFYLRYVAERDGYTENF